jgi:hypothetical protein
MERVQVHSTNIASVGYDPATETLEIEFRTGRMYTYYGVPPHMHEQLIGAASLGQFFNAHIRNVYSFDRTG